MTPAILKGITWGHSRGITPLLAASQRYTELHPDIEIKWEKRTLQEFADFPIEKLTEEYDLLIIDHPWVGCAAVSNCVLPLNEYLSEEYLNNQLNNSVGYSHKSYSYNNKQWALAIDAAAPVASYRKDLLQKNNFDIPQTWEKVIALAKMGKVAVPAIAIDLLMNFYSFCIASGSVPFANTDELIDTDTGIASIETMKLLYSLVNKKMFNCNPIAIAELMSSTNDYWYCPFAYGYSNYSREGYGNTLLHYTDVVSLNEKKIRTTLGGTGLAVSTFSKQIDVAINFSQWICSSQIQQSLYVQHGGQPGNRTAWLNEGANLLTNNFFKNTLSTLDNSFVRPRYNGYLHFQDNAGEPLQHCILNNGNPKEALYEMNLIYKNSLKISPSIIPA